MAATRLKNLDGLKTELVENITISQVAEALDIQTQASGDQWRSLCPLHEENTPSCYYSDAKGTYHCFGCKAGGDVIDLVERVRHLGFIEALYWLAIEADVDISQYERPMTDAEKEEEATRSWCESWLATDNGLRPTRVNPVVAERFGVTVHEALPANSPHYFSEKRYLLDGVILPWRLPSGRLVGWRVREHQNTSKNVIGTPNDFPLGKITEQTLFGIQIAREHITDGRLGGVEGEYDTMALHAAAIPNVVGLGGSTVTPGQMALLETLRVREFVLVFDGDEAGRLAAKTVAEKYWDHNIAVAVAVCPDGEDPESLVTKYGDWAFLQIYEQAPSALEYLLRLEWATRDRESLTGKLDFVRWIRDTYGGKLRQTDESIVLTEVARWLKIPEVEVRDFVKVQDTSLCAIDSERMLIGRACRDRSFYLHLRSRLDRDDFYITKHQRIWDVLSDMLIDGHEFDALTVAAEVMKRGLPEGYVEATQELPDANYDYHIDVVSDLALRRVSRDDALRFKDQIGELHRPAEHLVSDLTQRITTKALHRSGQKQRQLTEQVDEAMDTLHSRMRNPTEIHGLDLGTQYPNLSRILQGLQMQRLVLVSAISRVGKSTMLCHWACSLGVHQSVPVDLISLEMSELEILYKMASHMTNIDSLKITGGTLSPDEAKAVEYAMLRIRNSPLHIWAPDGLTGTEFQLYARESVMSRRTQAFFVDYVQLIDPEPGQERDNGYKLYGDFGRLCKMKIARGMNTAVVCAAQLRRDAAGKERPTAEDMGDSYAIVRHSDVIVILNGQEDSSTLELWVDKNRQGAGGGLIAMAYNKPTQTFHEAAGGSKLPEYAVRV